MNNNEKQDWYTKDAEERVTSDYEKNSKTELKSMNLGNENQSRSQMNNFTKARENQMAQARRKNTPIDFNARNYDIEELAAILKFEYVPLNKGIIQRRIYDLKKKFKQPKYQKFFSDAEKRLIDNLNLYNKQTWKDPQGGSTEESYII